MSKIKTPLFILFEGIDGCGKSTLCKNVATALRDLDYDVVELFEPSKGEHGQRVRQLVDQTEGALDAELLLRHFILDREDDVQNNLLPALKKGSIVLMDRYYYSNAAYQGAMGLPVDFILKENRLRRFPEPDRIYYLDLSPEESLQRVKARNPEVLSNFEKNDFLIRVRDLYLKMQNINWKILKASDSPEKLVKSVLDDLEEYFKKA